MGVRVATFDVQPQQPAVVLKDLLEHLFRPAFRVLDDDKHYWVGAEEVAKLLAPEEVPGSPRTPERELIHPQDTLRLDSPSLTHERAGAPRRGGTTRCSDSRRDRPEDERSSRRPTVEQTGSAQTTSGWRQ
jgi:hypothetical protein